MTAPPRAGVLPSGSPRPGRVLSKKALGRQQPAPVERTTNDRATEIAARARDIIEHPSFAA